MPTFGQNETGQRLHTSGVGAIYVLKSDEKKIVKVLQPAPGIWGDEQLREEIDGFLLRAKTQRNIAKGSQTWAPVHEASAIREGTEGTSGGGDAVSHGVGGGEHAVSGAYAVMDRYERSVASLIDGRVNVNNDDLRNLMSGVIRGLLDVRKIANRPHGNLKPTNILLTATADLAKATVHLSDPAPDGALGPKAAEKDLTDLAKIIYELVNLRPYSGGTVGRTKDWDELGPNGADWRSLCNTLLDPSAPPEERDLEKILAKIDTWRAKPKKSKWPMLIAAVVVLLIGGGVAAWFFTRPPKIDFDGPRWEKLCFTYQSWMGDFLDQMDDATKQKYSADPYPTEVVALINKAGHDLDQYQPRKIAKRPTSYSELAINPTDDAKTGYGPYYTKQGDELADNIAAALTPAKWPVLQKLDETATIYEKRGWQKPASGIRSIIAGAQPTPLPTEPTDVAERAKKIPTIDLAANIKNTITASVAVAKIEQRWNNIENEIKQLPATNVPLLQNFQKFAEDVPRSTLGAGEKGTLADVQGLSTAFASIDTVAKDLLSDLNSKDHQIVYDELAKDPAVQMPADGKLTIDMYTQLPDIAKGYFKIKNDPRTGVEWNKRLSDVQAGMIDIIADANKQDPHLPQLVAAHDGLQKEVAGLNAVSPIEKNHTQINDLVAKATADLKLLERNGNDWVNPYRTDPDQYVADKEAGVKTSPLAKATPVVYEQWKKAYLALLDKVRVNKAQLKTNYHYKIAVDDKFASLEKIYLAFDADIPQQVPGLSQVGGTDWRHTIASRVATTYRQDTLTDIMTTPNLPWAKDLPQVDNAAYQSYAKNKLDNYEQERRDALAMIGDFSALQDRLDRLELLPDQPAKGVATWRDLYGKWRDSHSVLLSDTQISGAVQPIADRANALSALDAVAAYQPLFDKTDSKAPEIVLTAWRKMGDATVSQDTPVLADEDTSEQRLATQINGLSKAGMLDANQLAAFRQEFAVQRPLRWHKWADTLTSATTIQTALDRRSDFGVTLNSRTDADMIFNDAYYQLKKTMDKNPKDNDAKAAANAFVAAVSTMPLSIRNNADIADLIARLQKSISQSQDDSSTAGAGPQLAGWQIDATHPGMRIFTSPSKRYVLKFLQLQAGQKTIYMCTTEMSVGIFADTVNGSGKINDLLNAGKPSTAQHWFNMPAKAGDDIWSDLGPRSWKLLDGKFDLNTVWLSEVAAQMLGPPKTPYYPGAEPPPPTADSPMQLLTPWSAMYAARLLGCRLPTSDEWTAADNKFEATGPKDAWNLRGAAWQAEQDYAKQKNSLGMPYPDQGIFLTPDLMFATTPVSADAATPWHNNDLAKIAPNRISDGNGIYAGSTIWFRDVKQAADSPNTMQDLVGNVAEYVFDAPTANAVVKNNVASVAEVDTAVAANPSGLSVIGGSSLSPPQIPFNQKQPLDPGSAQAAIGFCDVGFRLVYTAPIDSIADVLGAKPPPYLHGAVASR